nr:toprim domain-containing protein [Coralloluteibacterium stylophorae]
MIGKGPCEDCGSSDACASYSDGHTFCFSCGVHHKGEGATPSPAASAPKAKGEFLRGEAKALAKRGITEETCRKYGYLTGDHNGKTVQIANYRRDGQLVAQKVRYKPKPDGKKDMSVRGDLKGAGLYGQHLWEPGRRVVITEGEIDALTVAQVLNLRWPVVSVPNGAQGAAKAIKAEIEWLEQFESVVLMFDMDEPGQEAVAECVRLFSPGKCKVAQLPRKDPNEMLQAGDTEGIVTAIWQAQTYRPDGIVGFSDLRDRALKPVEQGLPWPWDRMNDLTYGRRYGEVYFLGAGTGVGKTDVFTEIIAYTAVDLGEKCGLFYLEQPPVETAKRVAGKLAGKRFHVPDGSWTAEELTEAFDRAAATGNLHLYDHFGSTEWDVILSKMRYLAVNEGVKHFFLDHLTALAAEAEDEKKALEEIMAQIAGFAQEHEVCFYGISHLATPEKGSHEEGARVTIRQFKGSRAIGFWSHFMFGLERDQQAEDPIRRSTTTFRFLKDRLTGQSVGEVMYLRYDTTTGRLSEAPPPSDDDASGFPDEGDDAPF